MAVKIAASSTLNTSAIGTTSLSVSSHTNTSATASSAPVLLTVQAEDTITATQFAQLVANDNADLTSAFVARILNAVNEAVADIVDTASSAPTIDLGWGKFVFEIAGSVATASAEPTDDNYCYFSGQVATKYQKQFALMDAYVATALNPCDLKRIIDASTSNLGKIYGTNVFYAEGRGFTFGETGDAQGLYSLAGTKITDLTLNATDSYANSLKLNIPNTATVPVGTYIVRIDCSIGGTVYRLEKKAEVMTAVIPTPVLAKAKQGSRPDNTIGFGTTLATVITGTIPGGFKATDGLKLEGVPDESGAYTATMSLTDKVTASTETSITLGNGFTNESAKPDSDWDGHAAKITLVRDATTYPLTINFVNE